MVGPKLDRYRIIESIGAGGMGEVYLARDERLERNVALKVLPSGILSDENARKRFRKEALTLSQLNHPNIATVFDFDSQDGVDFLVMEYVPGQTLDDRLNEGPLSEKEIALLGGQLVDGLAAAHSQNVVHRDLKPANLRVTPEGRLKILDFGLAKLVRPVSESLMSLTMEGGISGTLPYMAPEQLREEPVDGRTDLHAAGAVLYEFATGERPFQATKHAALIYSILSMDPPPPRKVNSKVPRELETVILKALEKAPGDRYQTANELGEDLNRWSEGTGVLARSRRHRRWKMFVAPAVLLATVLVLALNPGGIRDTITGADKTGPSIAILPCVNISGNPDEEYFADGMTDDLINQLSGLGSFSRVISTTTMLSYKGKQKTPKEIAEELQVSMVLSARVRQEGGMIHLSTQLIDPKTDEVLWGEKYVRNTGDVYALQGEVSQEVARALDLPISQNELRFLQSEKTVSPDAYRALKRGQEARRTPGADGSWLNANLRAVGFFQEAVGVDSTYALAYIELYRASLRLTRWGLWDLPPEEFEEKKVYYGKLADRARTKALELNPVFEDLFPVKMDDDSFRRIEALRPNDAYIYSRYSDWLLVNGRFAEAEKQHERALALDPGNQIFQSLTVQAIYMQRRFTEAEIICREMIRNYPAEPNAHHYLWLSLMAQGRFEDAIEPLIRFTELRFPNAFPDPAPLVFLMNNMANPTSIDEKTWEIVSGLSKGFGGQGAALLAVYLGDHERTIQYLQDAWSGPNPIDWDGFPASPESVGFPSWDPLRNDPRFIELAENVMIAWRNCQDCYN